MAFRETKVLYGDETIIQHGEFHLTWWEIAKLAETLATIVANHRDDDLGIVTLEIDTTNDYATAVVIVREFDDDDLDGGGYNLPLARYEIILAPTTNDVQTGEDLKRVDLRPLYKTQGKT
jgi:hypothetical protein